MKFTDLKKHQPQTILTLLNALLHRSATRAALQNRDEITLQPVLKALTRLVSDPRFVAVAVEVSLLVLDLYSGNMGASPEIDALMVKLHAKVTQEVVRAQQACQTGGMLDMLMSRND